MRSQEDLTKKQIQRKDNTNENFMKILQRYKDVFDYNKDAAHFIANNGTYHDNKERKEVLQVDALYVKLNQENKEIGLQMKNRV